MRDVAGEAVRATPVGSEGWIRHCPEDGSIADFQWVAVEANRLRDAGVIDILYEHIETQTGHRYVDAVRFNRLRE